MRHPAEFSCDECGRDLTITENCVGYRLAVVVEPLSRRGDGPVTLVHVPPTIDRDYHFCGLACLRRHQIALGERA